MVQLVYFIQLTNNNKKNYLFFRTEDESAPSNFQLLLGNYFYQVHQLLQDQDGIHHAEDTAAILQNFARKYERKLELNLGELSPEDLMRKLTADVAGNDVIGWHEEAYVQHLASLDKVNSFQFAVRVNHTQQMAFYFFSVHHFLFGQVSTCTGCNQLLIFCCTKCTWEDN